MKYKGFTLDQFQVDSINSINNNHSVVVSAPTGSGKTLIADYIIDKYLEKGVKVIYTAPIKALSNQKYKEFTEAFGEDKIGILTGDVVINSSAPILIMTTEIYRNMALTNDPMIDEVSYVIFDEIHFINDVERGYVWEESIIFSKSHVRFLCLSATIPNAEEFANWIKSIKKHPVDVIRQTHRHVPLERKLFTPAGICTLDEARDYYRKRRKMGGAMHIQLVNDIRHQTPALFFCFSRKRTMQYAEELSRTKIFNSSKFIEDYVNKRLKEAPPEVRELESTKVQRQTLRKGIAFHHAGLLPIIKNIIEELFTKGLIHVLYATETFAVGINMPAKTVCFASLRKFDGIRFRFLNSKEYFQMAGRAGRRGIDDKGFVYAIVDRRDFDYSKIGKIISKDMKPLESQFKLSVNTVLNLLSRHSKDEIDDILSMNFHMYQKYGKDYKRRKGVTYMNFTNIKKKLAKQGFLEGEELTKKGIFASKIYADEILIGNIFATDFFRQLNTYQVLLLIACIVYEPREKTEFYKKFKTGDVHKLRNLVKKFRSKKFRSIYDITALVNPCYNGQSIFEIMENTNLQEGDLIRFFRQMLDRMGQIQNATDDRDLDEVMRHCQHIIHECMEDIDVM